MNPLALALATAAAAAGFGIGEVMRRNLNRLNYRLDTERDQPEPSQRRWVPWITAAAAGLLSIAAINTPQPWLILPLLPLALTGAWLSAVDLDVYRLPNRVTGPVAAATAAGVAAAALATHNPSCRHRQPDRGNHSRRQSSYSATSSPAAVSASATSNSPPSPA